MGSTTIQVDVETADRLAERKRRGETYDDVVTRLLDETDDDGYLADRFRDVVDRADKDSVVLVDERRRGPDDVEILDEPAAPIGDQDVDVDARIADVVDELELRGGDEAVEARRDAVRACVDYLREQGEAQRKDFVADVYPDNPARYGTDNSWWGALGKEALREVAVEIEEINAPAGGQRTWYWRD